ncbi:hypothetical protein J2X19_003129 [Rhodoferax ferrireducens]|uniref:Uncharacterized protein n=1 Tax=Rhodoferax ferrireducens TaxID=192843 RepID=A0ABU2CAU1_9BURK|nr:hypothetical protein [Rhodoferax ferrireducens]MDR7378435.1 hypothetical protein [Rhodoferax ferrireducens]
MKVIGITGGGALFEVGPVTDVQLFFDYLNKYVARQSPDKNWSYLTDRLYRRYLKLEELDLASALMNQVKIAFSTISSTTINWPEGIMENDQTRLDPRKSTLTDVFEKYFESFAHCVESAKINYEGFKTYPGYKYEAVRFVIADQPWFMIEKKRPLEEYDALDGSPFWMESVA